MKLMEEIVEPQNEEQKLARKLARAQKVVDKQYAWHVENEYDWITLEVVKEYRQKVELLEEYRQKVELLGEDVSDTGIRRKLRIELQRKYGLLEIEAINILNGYNVPAYLAKYERIKNKIPLVKIQEQQKAQNDSNDNSESNA